MLNIILGSYFLAYMNYRIIKLIHPQNSVQGNPATAFVYKIPFTKKNMTIYDTVDFFEKQNVEEFVSNNKDNEGILICGTGMGVCMSANKVKGIRAALAYNESTAKLAKEHNNANVLCMGASEINEDLAKKITKKFLETKFSNGERHKRRIKEISELEK